MRGYGAAMKRYASFKGRAPRSEFWLFHLTYVLIVLPFLLLDVAHGDRDGPGILSSFVILIHFLPSLAVTVRRLHDVDRSGWLYLLLFIPIVGLILVVWSCLRGTPGPNRFGPDPLDPANNPYRQAGGAPPVAERRDLVGELERLAQLKASGSLSDAEYEVMKAKTLAGVRTG